MRQLHQREVGELAVDLGEPSRGIDRAVVRLAPVALDALSEVELVAARLVPMRQLHQREVGELAVDLGEPDVHGATLSDA
jgi:hypothetical protein